MKTKNITSESVAEWLATFYKYDSKEEYRIELQTMRCIFEADNDPEFWSEVCDKARQLINK